MKGAVKVVETDFRVRERGLGETVIKRLFVCECGQNAEKAALLSCNIQLWVCVLKGAWVNL